MRADQWIMVGVGALGVYAVYRMIKPAGAATLPEPALDLVLPEPLPVTPETPRDQIPVLKPAPLPPVPPPPPTPPAELPEQPGVLVVPQDSPNIVYGNPLKLQGGAWYLGRIEAGGGAEFLDSFLASMGFTSISTFGSATEAAQDKFLPYELASPGKHTRWFRARYPAFTLDGNPTLPIMARPAQLVHLRRVAAPAFTPL